MDNNHRCWHQFTARLWLQHIQLSKDKFEFQHCCIITEISGRSLLNNRKVKLFCKTVQNLDNAVSYKFGKSFRFPFRFCNFFCSIMYQNKFPTAPLLPLADGGGGVSGWVVLPVNHQLDIICIASGTAIKMSGSVNHLKVFIPQMLHIHFVKNIFTGCGVSIYIKLIILASKPDCFVSGRTDGDLHTRWGFKT